MIKQCWSQYVIIFEANHRLAQFNPNKTYSISLPRTFPDSLSLKESIHDLRKRFGTKFNISLLLQIEILEATNEHEQYFKLRDFFLDTFKEYWISPINEGMWNIPKDRMIENLIRHFYINSYNIVSTWGDWKDDFDYKIEI